MMSKHDGAAGGTEIEWNRRINFLGGSQRIALQYSTAHHTTWSHYNQRHLEMRPSDRSVTKGRPGRRAPPATDGQRAGRVERGDQAAATDQLSCHQWNPTALHQVSFAHPPVQPPRQQSDDYRKTPSSHQYQPLYSHRPQLPTTLGLYKLLIKSHINCFSQ